MQRQLNGQTIERKAFVRSLKENVDVPELLEHFKVRNISQSGKYINGSCPLDSHGGPDNTASFGMISEKGSKWNGFYKCFKCGKGSVVDFIMTMQNCDFNNAITFLREFSVGGDLYSESVLDREFDSLIKPVEEETELDEEEICFIPPMIKDSEYIAHYMVSNKKRKFETEGVDKIIRDYSIGLGYYRGEIHILVPVKTQEGEWKTFFAQNTEETKKKWFPKGSKISRYLFGLDMVAGKTKEIAIAEGVWDALKIVQFGIPCVSTFSTNISEEQAELLAEWFDTVTVVYDSDDGGEKGVSKAVELLFPEITLFRTFLPQGKDPCDCNREEFLRAFRRRKLVTYKGL